MSGSPSAATTEKQTIAQIGESAIPVTATPVAEVTSTPVNATEETALPVLEETAIPMTEQATIPTTEMDNDESNKLEPDPDQEVPAFNELRQLMHAFDPEMKGSIELVNAMCGVLVFFTQLGTFCLCVSSRNVAIDPTGFLVGIYLVMLASFIKYEKVPNVDLARYLIGFAMILGVALIALHIWILWSFYYNCQHLNFYCNAICSSPVPLDLSNVKNYLDIIFSLMVGCGICIVGFNGFFLFVLVFYKPKLKSL